MIQIQARIEYKEPRLGFTFDKFRREDANEIEDRLASSVEALMKGVLESLKVMADGGTIREIAGKPEQHNKEDR